MSVTKRQATAKQSKAKPAPKAKPKAKAPKVEQPATSKLLTTRLAMAEAVAAGKLSMKAIEEQFGSGMTGSRYAARMIRLGYWSIPGFTMTKAEANADSSVPVRDRILAKYANAKLKEIKPPRRRQAS